MTFSTPMPRRSDIATSHKIHAVSTPMGIGVVLASDANKITPITSTHFNLKRDDVYLYEFMGRTPENISHIQDYRDPPLTPMEEVGVHEISHRLAGTVFNNVTVGESRVYGSDRGVTFLYVNEPDALTHYTIRVAMLEASLVGERKAGIKDHSGCNHDQSMIRNIYNYVRAATNESVALQMLKDARNMARDAVNQISTQDLIYLGIVLAGDPNSQQFRDQTNEVNEAA